MFPIPIECCCRTLCGRVAFARSTARREHGAGTALNHEEGKTTVFVVGPDGGLQDRTVELGLETASDAQIMSGLNEGEQVVVSDRSGLKAGERFIRKS